MSMYTTALALTSKKTANKAIRVSIKKGGG